MKQDLVDIGNVIGKFIYVDPCCLGDLDKWVAWIVIEREYYGGFLDHIDLFRGETNLSHRLDFWGVAFRCAHCHHTRHLLAQCRRRLGGILHDNTFSFYTKGPHDGCRLEPNFQHGSSS